MSNNNAGLGFLEKNNWLLNSPFQQNGVYNQLIGMKYKYVLGMDVGHGDTVTFLATMKAREREDKTVEVYPDIHKLSVNDKEEYRIATMIGFDGDKVIIGREASKIPGFYQHFKKEPAQWGNTCRTRTFGNLMEEFIRELWKGIKRYNPKVEEAVEAGELLIAVGCPSSPAWTNADAVKKYQEVIERATGCSHVTVMAESTAAIMSAVHDANELNKSRQEQITVRLNRGLAVIDAGSSTIDFTYVLLGKRLITRSLTVAGHDLDAQILAAILDSDTMDISAISDDQQQDLLVEIRQMKEEFFPDQYDLRPRAIYIKSDTKENGYISVDYLPNKKLMDAALHRLGIQQNPFKPAMSWEQQVRKFVRDCFALIGNDENGRLLCDKVILTGGTSKVQLLRDIVAQECGQCEVHNSRDNSASVAKGLCYAKCMEIKGGSAVEGYRNQINKLAQDGYDGFIRELGGYLSGQACDEFQQVLAQHIAKGDTIAAGALLDEINQRVRENGNLTGVGCQKVVEKLFLKHFGSAQEEIYKKANEVSKSIYGAEASVVPEIPAMTEQELKQMLEKLDISEVIGGTWVSTMVAAIDFELIELGLVFLAIMVPALDPISAGLALAAESEKVREKVMQFFVKHKTEISPKMMNTFLKSIDTPDKRKKLEEKTGRKTAKGMTARKIFKEEFDSGISKLAEIMLGNVLFMVYREKPDTQ